MSVLRIPSVLAAVAAGALAAVSLAAGAGLATTARAEEAPALETIRVLLDQAKLVKLPTGAETVVIGNPSIADVTVQKNGVMVITGKAAGRTNFIALDASGSIISESTLSVGVSTAGRMLVQRGLAQNSYDCSPECLPTVTLGDAEAHFSGTVNQVGQRDGMGKGTNGKADKEKK